VLPTDFQAAKPKRAAPSQREFGAISAERPVRWNGTACRGDSERDPQFLLSQSPESHAQHTTQRVIRQAADNVIIKKQVDNDSRIPIYRNPTMEEDFDQFLPLSPAALHILMALVSEDRHGYGIMREVARQCDGRYKLGPGTLYDNLQKLLASGIVEESPRRASAKDPRRRYYRLTGFGRRLLSTEITRLEGVVREARLHLKPRLERA
jgi:DNA-binding PadR family transcriptional regulator